MKEEITSCSRNFPNSNNLKRKKFDTEDDAKAVSDRLSNLPEPLLVQIISSLDMKDAVKTGVLSKKWKNLWTHVDSVVIEHWPQNHEEENPNFFTFVDNILMHCNCPNIKKFNLCFFYGGRGKERILEWIQCVPKKNVEFLQLQVFNVGEIPECFYNNSSLVKMEIDSLTMGISRIHRVNWTCLKSLYLFEVSTNNEQISEILSGSPMLETLILRRVWHVTRLDIMSPSLKTLKLREFEVDKTYDPLEINAPWLHQLEISRSFWGFNCLLVDVSSLSKVDLSFIHLDDVYFYGTKDARWLNVLTKLLQRVQNVNEVTLGPVLIQALSVLKLLDRLSPLFNCKHLTACSPILKYDLPGVAFLLQSSPHLETLSIKVVDDSKYCFSSYFYKICDASKEKFLSLQKWNFQHLKKVTVIYTKTSCPGNEEKRSHKNCFLFELVQYLLRNAPALEKLVITSETSYRCRCAGYCAAKDACCFSRQALQLSYDNVSEWRFKKTRSAYEFIYS